MNTKLLFIYVPENHFQNALVSVYSFLKHNVWFDGEIVVTYRGSTITDEDKLKFLRIYYKTVFLEIDSADESINVNYDYLTTLEVYNNLSNINFEDYERILLMNHNTLFINDISSYLDDNIIVDINSLRNIAGISSRYVSMFTHNNTTHSIIFYDDLTPWENRRTKGGGIWGTYEDVIIDGGPYYELNLEDGTYKFHKNYGDRDKYIICTCAKNETDYIVEWVDHYLNLGFDKIFLCDNNEPNNDSLSETLSSYINRGVVEIFDCRHFNSFQVQFYSMFCTEGNYKWCGYFDCDEFLEIPSYRDIKHYLSTKQDEICVSFHWMVYGHSDNIIKSEGLIKDRFKYPVSPISIFTENCFVKSIVRGDGIFHLGCWFNGSHIPMTTPMYTHNVGGHFRTDSTRHCYYPPKYKDGYIRHYYTKSFGEWLKKTRRGWPDGTEELVMANYFVCEDWCNLPMEKMRRGLFSEYRDEKDNKAYYDFLVSQSNVINIINDSENVYGLLLGMYNIMSTCSDRIFMLGDEYIDDTTFNMILEYGIKTNNKVVWASTQQEKEDVFNKYAKWGSTYINVVFE